MQSSFVFLRALAEGMERTWDEDLEEPCRHKKGAESLSGYMGQRPPSDPLPLFPAHLYCPAMNKK